ncbi:coenzyme F420-0:L-glutamate ligase [Syntrophaceticus schinkii]|jgi:F420-0:gamma-glutamyl ligase|nr:coenzyme F420-0:L-glutamate ligase [Syntrophaceticus schinkii]MDD2359757.1 coenzyme F420-0:L-glutamate ligase [Syntrophaceticus schinkii]MDD4261263.1 coenzyme F420-0:L-glutamate ligase [Syntrophaceticus schinkii]MDD4674964.1 coenzyme F420-0:L-glutamate ligase [Syntrophaceticus schinkii]
MTAQAIPVNTKIITPDDNLLEVIDRYASHQLRKGDILAIAETVVAISQGRIIRPENVKPGIWALLISQFIHQDGSLSSPFALQAVINEEGTLRTVIAFIVSSLTRVFMKRKGDFYRLAGKQAALIDDITGTVPPFDKYIVLGPKNPEKVVAAIKKRFGVEAAIVDANDLGRTQILAATKGANIQLLLRVFKDNPAGNADEQTPLVIVRK